MSEQDGVHLPLDQQVFVANQRGDVAEVEQLLNSKPGGTRAAQSGAVLNAQIRPYEFPHAPADESARRWPYFWFDGSDGDTVLHLAVRYRHVAMVEMLVQMTNLDLCVRNDEGESAMEMLQRMLSTQNREPPSPAVFRQYEFGTWTEEADERILSLLREAQAASAKRFENVVVDGGGLWFEDVASSSRVRVGNTSAQERSSEDLPQLSGAARLNRKKVVVCATHSLKTRLIPAEERRSCAVSWVLIRTRDEDQVEPLCRERSQDVVGDGEENEKENENETRALFLCEREVDQEYERNCVRRIHELLHARGDMVEKVFVNPEKAELASYLEGFFTRHVGKTIGIYYIGHGGERGVWDMLHSKRNNCCSGINNGTDENEFTKPQHYSFGWPDLVEAGILQTRQVLLYLDSCYSAVWAQNMMRDCRSRECCQQHQHVGGDTHVAPLPGVYALAASHKPQKNFTGDMLLDILESDGRIECVVDEETAKREEPVVIVEELSVTTNSEDYCPWQFLFVPSGFAGNPLAL